MTGERHKKIAALSALPIAFYGVEGISLTSSIAGAVGFLPAVILGSLLPDIDMPNSKLGKHFKFLNKHMRHRGFTHSIFFLAMVTFLLYMLCYPALELGGESLFNFARGICFGTGLGIASHIVSDFFTGKVELFDPFCKVKLGMHLFYQKSFNGERTRGLLPSWIFMFAVFYVSATLFFYTATADGFPIVIAHPEIEEIVPESMLDFFGRVEVLIYDSFFNPLPH